MWLELASKGQADAVETGPIIIAILGDGRIDVGDGWQRIARAVRGKVLKIDAVVGTQRPKRTRSAAEKASREAQDLVRGERWSPPRRSEPAETAVVDSQPIDVQEVLNRMFWRGGFGRF